MINFSIKKKYTSIFFEKPFLKKKKIKLKLEKRKNLFLKRNPKEILKERTLWKLYLIQREKDPFLKKED